MRCEIMELTFGSRYVRLCTNLDCFILLSFWWRFNIRFPLIVDKFWDFCVVISVCVCVHMVFSILCIDLSITYTTSFVFWVTLVPYCWIQWKDAQSDRHTQRVRSKCNIWNWLKWHFRTESHFQTTAPTKRWRIYFFFGTKAAPYVYHNDWLILFLLNAFSVVFFFILLLYNDDSVFSCYMNKM